MAKGWDEREVAVSCEATSDPKTKTKNCETAEEPGARVVDRSSVLCLPTVDTV